jgi:hypothetical protein
MLDGRREKWYIYSRGNGMNFGSNSLTNAPLAPRAGSAALLSLLLLLLCEAPGSC